MRYTMPAVVALMLCLCAVAHSAHLTDYAPGGSAANAADVLRDVRVTWWPDGQEPPSAPSDPGLFTVKTDLHRTGDAAALTVVLTARRDEPLQYHIRLSAPFSASDWTRQFYPLLTYRILPPDQATTVRFLASADDATPAPDSPHVVYYPFGVLESDREFLLWGSLDPGKYLVLTPNADPGCIPCATFRPKTLRAGQEFRFALTLKRFAKPANKYRDVLRWYLAHLQNTDPLTRDILKYTPGTPVRHTKPGNLFGGTGALFGGSFWIDGKPTWQSAGLGKLWFQGWGDWQETYPTPSRGAGVSPAVEWWTESGTHMTAVQVQAEVAKLKAAGIAPLMYCRQFLAEEGTYDDKPPFKSWLGRDETGKPAVWSAGDKAPAALTEHFGIKTLSQSGADFGNADFLKWYIARVKAVVDTYNPGGIAWDMGWATPATWQFSHSNPGTAMCHGELRAQAELWDYLQRNHPDMQVIASEAPGTPSQLFAHGVLLEGGSIAGKGELDYEAAKALGTTIIAYEYPDQYATRCEPLDVTKYHYCAFRYKARNMRTGDGDYVVYLSEGIPGKEGCLIPNRDIVADDQWHTIVADCAKVPTVKGLKMIAFGEFASDKGDAHIQVEYIRFTDQPDGSPVVAGDGRPRPASAFPLEIRFTDSEAWSSRPEYLPGAAADKAGLTVADGIADFSVGTPGKGNRWLYTMTSSATAGELMMVLGYGACLGGGIAEGLPELYSFSAQAMGLPLLVDSAAIQTTNMLTASAWAGDGRLLIAAYNAPNSSAAGGTVTVRLPADETKHWAAPRAVTVLTLGPNGRPIRRTKTTAKPDAGGLLTFHVAALPGTATLIATE